MRINFKNILFTFMLLTLTQSHKEFLLSINQSPVYEGSSIRKIGNLPDTPLCLRDFKTKNHLNILIEKYQQHFILEFVDDISGYWNDISYEDLPKLHAHFLKKFEKFIGPVNWKEVGITYKGCLDLPCIYNRIYKKPDDHEVGYIFFLFALIHDRVINSRNQFEYQFAVDKPGFYGLRPVDQVIRPGTKTIKNKEGKPKIVPVKILQILTPEGVKDYEVKNQRVTIYRDSKLKDRPVEEQFKLASWKYSDYLPSEESLYSFLLASLSLPEHFHEMLPKYEALLIAPGNSVIEDISLKTKNRRFFANSAEFYAKLAGQTRMTYDDYNIKFSSIILEKADLNTPKKIISHKPNIKPYQINTLTNYFHEIMHLIDWFTQDSGKQKLSLTKEWLDASKWSLVDVIDSKKADQCFKKERSSCETIVDPQENDRCLQQRQRECDEKNTSPKWSNSLKQSDFITPYAQTTPQEHFAEASTYYRFFPEYSLLNTSPSPLEFIKKKVFNGEEFTVDNFKKKYSADILLKNRENLYQNLINCRYDNNCELDAVKSYIAKHVLALNQSEIDACPLFEDIPGFKEDFISNLVPLFLQDFEEKHERVDPDVVVGQIEAQIDANIFVYHCLGQTNFKTCLKDFYRDQFSLIQAKIPELTQSTFHDILEKYFEKKSATTYKNNFYNFYNQEVSLLKIDFEKFAKKKWKRCEKSLLGKNLNYPEEGYLYEPTVYTRIELLECLNASLLGELEEIYESKPLSDNYPYNIIAEGQLFNFVRYTFDLTALKRRDRQKDKLIEIDQSNFTFLYNLVFSKKTCKENISPQNQTNFYMIEDFSLLKHLSPLCEFVENDSNWQISRTYFHQVSDNISTNCLKEIRCIREKTLMGIIKSFESSEWGNLNFKQRQSLIDHLILVREEYLSRIEL